MIADLLAKGVAVAVAVLLTAVVGVLVLTSRPPSGANLVKAEFDDAFPLIEGMHVRVDGAIAGSVGRIEVNDRGNAVVDLALNDSIEPPRADATAAIRQQDTTGDSYVAFEPGDSEEPLGEEGITCEVGGDGREVCPRTLVRPRLDDLLNAFGRSERAGVQLILVETAKALDRRGRDLNEAALALRPAFESANEALGEVRDQNDALRQLISSAEAVTGQAAERNRELGRLVESLAATTNVTAAESAALDAGLERLPETTARARTMLAALTRTSEAAEPLASELASGAPDLATALERTPGFLDHASGFLEDTKPTIDLTREVLEAAEPTLKIGKERVVTGPFDLTGATADLLNAVLGGEDAFPALFGDDSYGVGEGTLGKRGFGAVAVEPGDRPGYPAEHEPRKWLRVSAVINCEVFGLPVRPGCLADALASSRARASGDLSDSVERVRSGLRGGGGPGGGRAGDRRMPGRGGGSEAGSPGRSGLDLQELRPGGVGGPGAAKGRAGDGPRRNDGLSPLFDYLLGNG